MKRFVILCLLAAFLLTGCSDLENVAQTIDEESLKIIEDIELLLLEFQFNRDRKALKEALTHLSDLEERAVNNKYFEARIFGLYGYSYYLRNNMVEVSTYINEISRRSRREEYLYLLESLLEGDLEKKEKILLGGKDRANSKDRIMLFLGELYFYQGMFKDALAAYDESFLELPEEYAAYFKKRRELSYQFNDEPPENVEILRYLAEDVLQIAHVLRITHLETDFFHNISDDKEINPRELLSRLTEMDYIKERVLEIDDEATRKVIAFLLLNVVAYLDNEPELLDKYKKEINYETLGRSGGAESPVPDLDLYDYFYTAVLVLVEREIMELPDGENFFPEKSMSGIEYYEILKRLKEYY